MLAPVEGTLLERPLSPHERLWRAVLEQALVDAFFERVGTSTSVTSDGEQQEARLFLYSTGGAWARARRQVCNLAGLDEQALEDRLKNEPPQDGDPRAARKKETKMTSPSTRKPSPDARGRE